MVTATWNGKVLARSNRTVLVEGNHYFPVDSLNIRYFAPSELRTTCFWKGEASYYDIVVNGKRNPNAAWYYPCALDGAKVIEGYVAFWQGIEVKELLAV